MSKRTRNEDEDTDPTKRPRLGSYDEPAPVDGNSGFLSDDEDEGFLNAQEYVEHLNPLEELKNEIEYQKGNIIFYKKDLTNIPEGKNMYNKDVSNKEIEAAEEKLKELETQLSEYNSSQKGGNKHKKTMKKKGKKKGKKKSKKVRKKRKKTMKKKKKGKKKKKKGKSKKARK